jgi:hypothetical protein
MLLRRNPERTAWVVLWAAFIAFCFLLYFVPVGLGNWATTAQVNQVITINHGGTVFLQRPGFSVQEVPQGNIPVGATLYTIGNAQATLNFAEPGAQRSMATVVVYGDATIIVERAFSPRFAWWSSQPHEIRIRVDKGVVAATNNLEPGARAAHLQIDSVPNVLTTLEVAGSRVRVDATQQQMVVTVREGEATVIAQGETRTLTTDQRVEVSPGLPPSQPLSAERNIIRDGEFQQGEGVQWVRESRGLEDQAGTIAAGEFIGRQAVRFQRTSEDWGEIGLRQDLGNLDVRDFDSLVLQFDLLLRFQSTNIYNCGDRGTECPLMVKVKYVDEFGSEREWLQGLYYNNHPIFGKTFCLECPPPRSESHIQIDAGVWRPYQSENLLALFRAQNVAAAILKSVSVYGAGHSFESYITQVQALVSN